MKDTVTVASKLENFYAAFSVKSLDDIGNIYHPDVEFTDPVHTVTGVDSVTQYFENVMRQTQECSFAFEPTIGAGDTLCLPWVMKFSHPKIQSGEQISVDGVTIIDVDQKTGKVIRHRDYYDMGAMIYEHVPVMGFVIDKIKKRMS